MAIDPIPEIGNLPAINREKVSERGLDEVVDYLVLLVKSLQDDLTGQFVSIINLLLSLVNVGVWYSALPDSDGVYPEGTWRIRDDGTDLLIEVYQSSVWVIKWKFEAT